MNYLDHHAPSQEAFVQFFSWAVAVAFFQLYLYAPGLCDPSASSFGVAATLLLLQVCTMRVVTTLLHLST